jgi:hypothetical protein
MLDVSCVDIESSPLAVASIPESDPEPPPLLSPLLLHAGTASAAALHDTPRTPSIVQCLFMTGLPEGGDSAAGSDQSQQGFGRTLLSFPTVRNLH